MILVHSTKEVAKAVGITHLTLQRWVARGGVQPSQRMKRGVREYWLWTDQDIARVRRYKEKNYYKGRGGSKPTPKQ